MKEPLIIDSSQLDYAISQEMVYYDQYYRLRGIRNYALFLTPKFSLDERFELPVNAIVHYLPESQTELGISPNHIFLRKATTYILADHALEPATRLGNPMSANVPANKLIMMYRNQSNKIRPLKNLETALGNPRIIITMNYSIMNRMLRYKKVYQARVFKFKNTLATFVQKANELAAASDRQQYLQVILPKVIPTKQQFVRGTAGLTRVTMNMFPDDESLFLLELWIWLSAFRERSVLSGLSKDAISKLNLVFFESGYWTMLNLGLLDDLRKDPTDLTSKGDKKPQQLQLALLRFLGAIFTIRTVAAKTTLDVKTTEVPTEVESDDDVVDEVVNAAIDGEEIEDLERLESSPIDDALDLDGSDVEIEEGDDQVKFIEVDEHDDLVEPRPDYDDDFSDSIVKRSEGLAQDGLLSTAEHRRYERLSRTFETLPNPFGDGTLKDALTIDPAIINDFKSTEFVDQPTVVDKSMLKSTIVDWDSRYIKHAHHKHVAKMVMGLQQAGVAVTSYNVEKKTDANSQYEIHEVRVVPVGGAPSTIRFKLPVLKEDGTFKSAGINYRQRKQRADIPIRKVNPSEVALTTYYAKIFVSRSTRKVNDYAAWLHRTLVETLPTKENVKVVEYGRVFDSSLKVPRVFSIMAKRYKTLKVNGIDFHFDIKQLRELLPKDVLDGYLNAGEIPCGIKGDTIYVMGKSGVIYQHAGDAVLGTLEEFIGLPMEKAPIEAVELTALGKSVPLAMLLGQKYGLTNLMRRLKADYRQVPRGGRLDLQSDEFVIRFADQSLVFSRQQPMVSLIMGSLSRYRKSLENYDLEEFDNDDVYAAIYELEGLGARYLKEAELLYDVFIDPISKDILGKLKEPTTFGPLLLRAAELLTTDDHPDEMDGRYLRVRGYERISGAVYKEIMKGVRQYRLKPITARSSVDVNPNAVWMEIMKDPALSIVEESNPIQNLKEVENVTFGGSGGRSSRTMVKRTRAFNKHDMGLITEANVDNGEVGVTGFLSQNAKLGDLYGLSVETATGESVDLTEQSRMVSTVMMLSPGSDRDELYR